MLTFRFQAWFCWNYFSFWFALRCGDTRHQSSSCQSERQPHTRHQSSSCQFERQPHTRHQSGRSESSPSLPPFARGTTLVQLALKNNSTSNDYSGGSSDLEESGVLTMEDGLQVPLSDVFFADIDEVFLTYLIHSKLSSLQFSNVFPVAKIFTLG
jgi:hypothetical protein